MGEVNTQKLEHLKNDLERSLSRNKILENEIAEAGDLKVMENDLQRKESEFSGMLKQFGASRGEIMQQIELNRRCDDLKAQKDSLESELQTVRNEVERLENMIKENNFGSLEEVSQKMQWIELCKDALAEKDKIDNEIKSTRLQNAKLELEKDKKMREHKAKLDEIVQKRREEE